MFFGVVLAQYPICNKHRTTDSTKVCWFGRCSSVLSYNRLLIPAKRAGYWVSPCLDGIRSRSPNHQPESGMVIHTEKIRFFRFFFLRGASTWPSWNPLPAIFEISPAKFDILVGHDSRMHKLHLVLSRADVSALNIEPHMFLNFVIGTPIDPIFA